MNKFELYKKIKKLRSEYQKINEQIQNFDIKENIDISLFEDYVNKGYGSIVIFGKEFTASQILKLLDVKTWDHNLELWSTDQEFDLKENPEYQNLLKIKQDLKIEIDNTAKSLVNEHESC